MSLGTKVGLCPCHIVLDWDSALPKRGTAIRPRTFGQAHVDQAHVGQAQTFGCIRMSLTMPVGLGSRHIVLDGTHLPQKGRQPLSFGHV